MINLHEKMLPTSAGVEPAVMFIESLFLYWRNVARLLFVNPRNICLSNVTSLFVMDVVMYVLYMRGVGHD